MQSVTTNRTIQITKQTWLLMSLICTSWFCCLWGQTSAFTFIFVSLYSVIVVPEPKCKTNLKTGKKVILKKVKRAAGPVKTKVSHFTSVENPENQDLFLGYYQAWLMQRKTIMVIALTITFTCSIPLFHSCTYLLFFKRSLLMLSLAAIIFIML